MLQLFLNLQLICALRTHLRLSIRPTNSFLFDTMGRIHESKIKILYGPVLADDCVIEVNDANPLLSLAFEAINLF